MRNRGTRLRVFAVFFTLGKKLASLAAPQSPIGSQRDCVPTRLWIQQSVDHVRRLVT